MLTGDDELGYPEQAEDVKPTHSQNPIGLLIGHESRVGALSGGSQRLDEGKAGDPTGDGHAQCKKGLHNVNESHYGKFRSY